MLQRLRFLFPASVICLAVLALCVIGFRSRAEASERAALEADAAVTYNADAGEIAGPAVALETAAVLDDHQDIEKQISAERDIHSDFVPPQQPRDSGYELTENERMTVERIVMCEAGGEGERGQMMVAQCILEGLLRYDYTIEQYIRNYKVELTSYSNVTDEVRNSVSRVFDNGERVIEERADLWYNPAITASEWHEEQEYVITIGSHRFFWMIDDTHA